MNNLRRCIELSYNSVFVNLFFIDFFLMLYKGYGLLCIQAKTSIPSILNTPEVIGTVAEEWNVWCNNY